MSRAREVELQEEVASLRQEKQDLQYNICLLEEDNQNLREEIQNLEGKISEPWLQKNNLRTKHQLFSEDLQKIEQNLSVS